MVARKKDITVSDSYEQFEFNLDDDQRKLIVQTQTAIFKLIGIRGLYASKVEPESDKIQTNTNYQAILMFLQSKDDNLLLQICGLLHAI